MHFVSNMTRYVHIVPHFREFDVQVGNARQCMSSPVVDYLDINHNRHTQASDSRIYVIDGITGARRDMVTSQPLHFPHNLNSLLVPGPLHHLVDQSFQICYDGDADLHRMTQTICPMAVVIVHRPSSRRYKVCSHCGCCLLTY